MSRCFSSSLSGDAADQGSQMQACRAISEQSAASTNAGRPVGANVPSWLWYMWYLCDGRVWGASDCTAMRGAASEHDAPTHVATPSRVAIQGRAGLVRGLRRSKRRDPPKTNFVFFPVSCILAAASTEEPEPEEPKPEPAEPPDADAT